MRLVQTHLFNVLRTLKERKKDEDTPNIHAVARTVAGLGARPQAIDAEAHDRLMATVSHLPHVVANALVGQAAAELSRDSERMPEVGPSFRDTTRVAGSNPAIWGDIFASNRESVAEAIDAVVARLREAADAGWLGVVVPDAAVGLGLVATELAIIAEAAGRGLMTEPIAAVAASARAIADGGNDALTNALSRLGTVGVASRATMMSYKGSSKPTREIAQEQNLDAVIDATVFRAGTVMRINVQFEDPTTTRTLWSDTYERDVQDVLAAQNDIVQRIAAAVARAAPLLRGQILEDDALEREAGEERGLIALRALTVAG